MSRISVDEARRLWNEAADDELIHLAAGHRVELLIGHVMSAHPGVVPIRDVERAIRCDADIRWAKPGVVCAEDVRGCCLVASTVVLNRIGAHDPRSRIGVNYLVAKNLRQQFAFIHCDARGRASARLQ